LSILYLFTKLKAPHRATDAAVRVRGSAHSPVAVEDAPTSRPARKCKAHFCVTLCHGSMVTLLVLTLFTGMRLGRGFLDSPLGGPHGRWSAVLRAMAPTGVRCGVDLSTVHCTGAWLLLLHAGIYPGYMFYAKAARRLRMPGKHLGPLCRGIRTGGCQRSTGWSASLLVSWFAFCKAQLYRARGNYAYSRG